MVLLNLNAQLKSLPLPFGRKSKSSTPEKGSPRGNEKKQFRSGGNSPRAEGGRMTPGSQTSGTGQTGYPGNHQHGGGAVCSTSLAEALLNYSIVGANVQLASGDHWNTTNTPNEETNRKSQTLPASLTQRTPCFPGTSLFDQFVLGSTDSPNDFHPQPRCRRSMSTSHERVPLRRRLMLNPSWKAACSRDVRRTRSFNVHSAKMSPPEERDEVDAIRPTSPTSTPESPSTLRKRHKPLVVKKVDARELVDKQSIAGYLERKSVSAQWIRYWFVLHEGTLFCYLTADDNVTVDVLNLHGYTVTSLVDKFRGKRFVLQLSHENFTSLHISFESREEMESWDACLNEALDMQSSRVSDGADSTLPSCSECTSNRDDEVGEKRKQVKQKLLEEMLRQKHELEKKQAQRQKKQGRISLDSPERQTLPEFTLEDQRTSDVTRLKQRRMSTQLKVDTIQKQIEKPSGTKRGLFSFGKTKKVDENKNEYLQDQIKELNEKLHKIDTDLNHVGSDKYYDSFDVNQNKKNSSGNMPSQLMTSLLMTSDRPIDSDDENGRSKTIKSAVQKWTNKTFAAKKKPNSNGKPSLNGSLPNMAMKYNGDINLNGDSEPETDTCSGEYLESSVTDLTRPLADLKLSLNLPLSASQNSQNSSNGSCSPSLIQYNRSTSRTSTASSLSSPRREINPSVLAEIDAFEELTKQVLGARSRDVTAK